MTLPKFVAQEITKEAESKCPICDGFRFSWQKYCDDCTKYKDAVDEKRKRIARRKSFGNLW
jgi:hypothetical protein